MRRTPEKRDGPASFPRWHRWLNGLPAGYYLLAAIVVAALIIAFVLWLDTRTLALVSGLSFMALLVWLCRSVWLGWAEAQPVERSIGILGCLLLLGACVARLVQFLLIR
jgi:hypothetical protein